MSPFLPTSHASNPYRSRTDNIPVSPYTYNRGVEEIEHKGFTIRREQEFLLWDIIPQDNSRLPTVLKSKYTNTDLAKQAIDAYLLSKKQPKKDALDNGAHN